MRVVLAGVLVLLATQALARPDASAVSSPPVLKAQPVVDDYHGVKVEDRFRFVEKQDPDTVDWMKAQAAHTRKLLDSIKPRASLVERMSSFGGAFSFVEGAEYAGDRLFYTERPPGIDQYSLVVREPDGRKRVLVDVPALIKTKGHPVAIDGFEPSRDGRFVALRMSEKGSEDSTLTILDVASGRTIAGPIWLGPFTATSWDADGVSLFFTRMPDPATTPVADRYINSEILHWTFGQDPRVVVSAKQRIGPNSNPRSFPELITPQGTDRAILMVTDGVESEMDAWEAPRADVAAGRARWRKIASIEDGVIGLSATRDGLVFLTHKNAPGFKVTRAPWDGTAAEASVILPPQEGLFYDRVHASRDAVYVGGRQRLTGAMWRIGKDGGTTRLTLPSAASVDSIRANGGRDGAIVTLTGFATPYTRYAYRHDTGFIDLALTSRPASLDLTRYSVSETNAVAADGTKVPLVILAPAGPRQPRPFLINAYGAYGVNTLPFFSQRFLVGVDAGLGYATCSVRGGGELGEAWRLGGKDALKPNTWRDAIACAQKLIADGYTTPGQLAIMGRSAGGIMVGRAVTERPDLFTAAISAVGVSNLLRFETTASGASNIPEYGSVKTEAGFRNLLAMDTYSAVKDGVKLPPFLLTTGLEDPRVPSWQAAKLAARLLESGNMALLHIDDMAGHGLGSTRSARDLEHSDIIAFILWRAGAPGWQPEQ